jgi:hypothetical protein
MSLATSSLKKKSCNNVIVFTPRAETYVMGQLYLAFGQVIEIKYFLTLFSTTQ